jgi:uncharacterized protein YneF (UPF0154 family)
MSSDTALIMGIILLLMLGACMGWYLCERWYAKRFKIILEECKNINEITLKMWEDILSIDKEVKETQDQQSK